MTCLEGIIQENNPKLQEQFEAFKKATTLAKMMLIAFRIGCLLAIIVVEKELAQRADRPCQWPKCPKCGSRIENKGREKRQMQGIIGIVCWKRKVGYCPNGCKIGQIVPLDDELGIAPSQQASNDLKRACCALAIFVPYGISATLLNLLTGITISGQTIWRWTQEAGKKTIEKLEKELNALQTGEHVNEEAIDAETTALPLLIGGDGVMVPFRPEKGSPEGKTIWKEVKIGIFARLKQYVNTKKKLVTRLLRRRLVAVLGNKDEFAKRMELESKKQGIEKAETVMWISDGGRGYWNVFKKVFSKFAIGILDFYHAAQNLWKAASICFDGRTNEAKKWFKNARHLLRNGEVYKIIADISKMLLFAPRSFSIEGRKALVNLCVYLSNHYLHVDYPTFKEMGLPIGSGMVESACKWLIQQRFKCTGMRWSEDGFNNLLHLRLVWVNGRFDEIFGFDHTPGTL